MICLPAGAQSGLARGSQAFTRTMDMLGWGSLREDPASRGQGQGGQPSCSSRYSRPSSLKRHCDMAPGLPGH